MQLDSLGVCIPPKAKGKARQRIKEQKGKNLLLTTSELSFKYDSYNVTSLHQALQGFRLPLTMNCKLFTWPTKVMHALSPAYLTSLTMSAPLPFADPHSSHTDIFLL